MKKMTLLLILLMGTVNIFSMEKTDDPGEEVAEIALSLLKTEFPQSRIAYRLADDDSKTISILGISDLKNNNLITNIGVIAQGDVAKQNGKDHELTEISIIGTEKMRALHPYGYEFFVLNPNKPNKPNAKKLGETIKELYKKQEERKKELEAKKRGYGHWEK